MGRIGWALAAAAIASSDGSARADDLESVAARFAARPSVIDASLSPDGSRVAVVGARKEGGEVVTVIDIATSRFVPVLYSQGGDDRVTHCQFVIDARLVCGAYVMSGSGRTTDALSRLLSVATDGSGAKMLTARQSQRALYDVRFGGKLIDFNVPGSPQSVLVTRWVGAENTTGSMIGRANAGLAVEKVDLVTLARSEIEQARQSARDYVGDGHGKVRLMLTVPTTPAGYLRNVQNYLYRPGDGGAWQALSSVEIGSDGSTKGFLPIAVDGVRNLVYGLDTKDGTTALWQLAPDAGSKPELLLHSPKADIDGLVRIGRDQRVVGASYVTEKRHVEYFDPELRRLAGALSRALAGQPQISIADASEDEQKLLIFASSDTNPGILYLYERATKKLSELLPLRDELAGAKLASMQAVTFPARDGTQIPGYLTLPPGSDGKNLPAIVMPHGGPAARDEWGFDWLVQFYAARGFAVLQPNYRGSAGYGAKWFERNGFQSWTTAMNDIIDAGRWLVHNGTAQADRLAVLGWSYGGYAALQTSVVDPDAFKAVVAIAPATDLDRLKEERREYENYRRVEQYIGIGPHVAAGSPARHADRFKAPVLLFHGDRDVNVGVGESRLMRDRLLSAGKTVHYTEFPNLDHQLDNADARMKMLVSSDQFLRKALGL